MADEIDMANDIVAEQENRAIAAARAAAAVPDPVPGTCEACCDKNVMVRPRGGMPRCTDCREKWEKRQ